MTTFDKAFIKAFTDPNAPAPQPTGARPLRTAQPVQPLKVAAASVMPVAQRPIAQASVSQPPFAQPSIAQPPIAQTTIAQPSIAAFAPVQPLAMPAMPVHVMPPIHAAPLAASERPRPILAVTPIDEPLEPLIAEEVFEAKATMDAFVRPGAARPLSSYSAPVPSEEAFRALLEVDRLLWPAASMGLLARARSQWETFADDLLQQKAQGKKCIALVSCQRGEGRTTVSLALTKLLAGRGVKALLVDADFENPALARSCGISVHTGWDDLVTGDLPPGEALICAAEDGATLMPWRGPAIKMTQLAASRRTTSVFDALRRQYDLVLFDTLPLAGQSTIGELAQLASAVRLDAVYLVQDVRYTSRQQLVAVSAKLRRAGLPLVAVIQNFVTQTVPDDAGRLPQAKPAVHA